MYIADFGKRCEIIFPKAFTDLSVYIARVVADGAKRRIFKISFAVSVLFQCVQIAFMRGCEVGIVDA